MSEETEPDALRAALSNFIYETTHLSAQREDGSHECCISAATLNIGREALKAVNATARPSWKPIDTAPKDGSPVWVRGWDFGNVNGKRHHCWAYWDGAAWQEPKADEPSTLLYLTDWC